MQDKKIRLASSTENGAGSRDQRRSAEGRTLSSVLLRVPAGLAYRELACRTVSTVCKMCVAVESTVATRRFSNELMSAVGEAFNNIVIHAYGGRGGTIELRLTYDEEQVTVELLDDGVPFDFDGVPELDLRSAHEKGMGVHIIRSFVDEAQYRPGPPNVLALTKRTMFAGGRAVACR
ncbi:MAG: ATP-binding protein [Polyangiaceae bacterium]|nr:ATP-binding protein [Polyangiaceae bacterium]